MSGWGQAHINNTIGFGGGVSCGGFTGLLDDYPGAAAAYSLRQLSSSYTGSAIRVRRSSDNAEQDIGFVSNELDTTSLLSFVGGGDGFVTTWYDQSGGSNNVTQASAAAQPQVVSSGSLILENGKPALSFDGIDDYMQTSSTFSITQTSAFTVGKFNVLVNEAYPVLVQSTNNTGFRQHLNSGYIRGRFSGTNIDDTSILPNNIHHLFTIINDGSIGSLFWNGTTAASGAAPLLVDPTANLLIGSDGVIRPSFNDGISQEIIVYPSDQSSNRAAIETNINNFYSIYP